MNVTQKALFEIPMWVAQLDEVVPYHEAMAKEAEELIDRDNSCAAELRPYLAHQTTSDPFDLPNPGWKLLDSLCNDIFSNLAKQNFQRWRAGEFHLRRWAIRFGRLTPEEKARLARDAVHNHLPALFSSIYYLRLPPEFAENPSGGTVFVNPIGNLMDLMSPRTRVIEPKEGRLLVFPSFVDHAPAPVEWDANGVSRIVISTDVFYTSGRTRNAVPLLKAEAGRERR
ncbi:MAG TPA: putative 2OG-Fe(II) oxygenase [Bryobacteraceae bacterium]|nr:putative 2OG-Fe(II) oxygenase [Bryobacteraceae bacterium]